MNLALATVTHNELHSRLPRLLYSIDKFFSKTPGNHEIMHYIWDNASTDGTGQWLETLDRSQRVFRSQENVYDLPAYNSLASAADLDREFLFAINPNTRVVGEVDFDEFLRPFREDEKLVLLGRPGPRVLKENATPHGVEGWGWVARLLEERDFWEEGDVTTAHVQSWSFIVRLSHFLELGGFRFRNRRFDMREPEERFPEKPIDYSDKGNMIASEVELSVRARREGYTAGYMKPWPFYHYCCHGDSCSSVEKMDGKDKERGFEPLGYHHGDWGEDKWMD